MKLPASLLAASLALAALLGPTSASAASHHRASHGPVFPMKAEEYRAYMEKRIDSVRAVIERKLDRRGVSADRKKAIHKIFDDSAKDLRAEIARVAADGTVTEGEATKVKPLLTGLRAKVRERLRAEKDPHAKGRIEKEETTKKDKAKAAKEGAAKEGHKKPAAPEGGSADGEETHHAKATEAHKAGGQTKPTKATAPKKKADGATKPAKAGEKPAKKKPKPAETEGGADL